MNGIEELGKQFKKAYDKEIEQTKLERMCKKEKFEMDTRVGHGSTSVLEHELKKYIIANTINCKYVGEPKYLQIYAEISNYNLTTNDEN